LLTTKEVLPKLRGLQVRSVFFNDAARERPIANCKGHVLSNAERDDGLRAAEDAPVCPALDGIIGLAQPQMPQREGLVPRELPPEIVRCDRPAQHLGILLDDPSRSKLIQPFRLKFYHRNREQFTGLREASTQAASISFASSRRIWSAANPS